MTPKNDEMMRFITSVGAAKIAGMGQDAGIYFPAKSKPINHTIELSPSQRAELRQMNLLKSRVVTTFEPRYIGFPE